jgi:hypothetical protein
VISAPYLSNLQTDFNRIRNAGFKVILRPLYTANYDPVVQPNKATILNHISQLAAVINANNDVIISVQAGFIGVYGEWYYTSGSTDFGDTFVINTTQWQNRKEVVDTMFANFETIPLQVRTAFIKRQLYGSTFITEATAFQNTTTSKVGFYNDAFLNEDGDLGTYDISGCVNPYLTTDYNFISNAGKYLPMNGETNGFNPCNSGFRTSGVNAVVELNELNFSTLSADYFPGVWNNWISDGYYGTIVRNLGYRIQLNTLQINVTSTINVTLNLQNVGYGNILTPKTVSLVFASGATEYKKVINTDARFWTASHTITQSLTKDIPNGQYDLLLHIEDINLTSRPEYSIRVANSDVTFDSITGYNDLLSQITIS